MMDKAILTCALTGVLTNPSQHPVPVTPEPVSYTHLTLPTNREV